MATQHTAASSLLTQLPPCCWWWRRAHPLLAPAASRHPEKWEFFDLWSDY